jgi:hypothetical protein
MTDPIRFKVPAPDTERRLYATNGAGWSDYATPADLIAALEQNPELWEHIWREMLPGEWEITTRQRNREADLKARVRELEQAAAELRRRAMLAETDAGNYRFLVKRYGVTEPGGVYLYVDNIRDERDGLRRERDEASTALDDITAALGELWPDGVDQPFDRLNQIELLAMMVTEWRPVVEAAKAWQDAPMDNWRTEAEALQRAVDRLRAQEQAPCETCESSRVVYDSAAQRPVACPECHPEPERSCIAHVRTETRPEIGIMDSVEPDPEPAQEPERTCDTCAHSDESGWCRDPHVSADCGRSNGWQQWQPRPAPESGPAGEAECGECVVLGAECCQWCRFSSEQDPAPGPNGERYCRQRSLFVIPTEVCRDFTRAEHRAEVAEIVGAAPAAEAECECGKCSDCTDALYGAAAGLRAAVELTVQDLERLLSTDGLTDGERAVLGQLRAALAAEPGAGGEG